MKAGDENYDDALLGPVILEQKATHAIGMLFLLLGAALSGLGLPGSKSHGNNST
jgi:hypothetical protein